MLTAGGAPARASARAPASVLLQVFECPAEAGPWTAWWQQRRGLAQVGTSKDMLSQRLTVLRSRKKEGAAFTPSWLSKRERREQHTVASAPSCFLGQSTALLISDREARHSPPLAGIGGSRGKKGFSFVVVC